MLWSAIVSIAAIIDPGYSFLKDGIERILSEDVFNVGQEKLLVLLLVMKTKRQNRLDLGEERFVRVLDQLGHTRVDRVAEAISVRDRRPRDQPAQVAPMHVAGGVVIGIKKIGVLRDFRPVTRHPNFHDEGFEEPARVSEMPFGWTHVWHRLDDIIF